MKTQQVKDDLEQLLADNSDLAKAANERAGLAEIASLLLQTRHELDLSQKALAERAGLTKSMISEIENTANDGVTLRTLVKLARAAGASLQLGFCLSAARPGSVSTSLDTGRYEIATARVAKPAAGNDLKELAA
jgi:transcriptional regulator with XRE-family HTH domain